MNASVTPDTIDQASKRIHGVSRHTPLEFSKRLSEKYQAKIYLKREDLQEIRSYKIRGAYNFLKSLTPKEKKQGVVCNSAGNHAQGVARAASMLKIHATIFMPRLTPTQKVEKVNYFGGNYVTVKLIGDTFDDAFAAAKQYCEKNHAQFVSAINDARAISGQGTVGKEIYDDLKGKADVILVPVGGGGLLAGIATYWKEKKGGLPAGRQVKIIGVEPEGAACMTASLKAGKVVMLPKIDTFVDGAAMKRVGDLSYALTKLYVDDVLVIPEGKVCIAMIDLYQHDGIIAEPAGALSISALDSMKEKIKGKIVVCIVSGGNNDLMRYPEIIHRAEEYLKLHPNE